MEKSKFVNSLLVFLLLVPALASAERPSDSSGHQTIVIVKQTRSLGIEPFVEIAVGVLALLLFVVSALAYWRDRRKRFLAISLAYLVFSVKGILGVLDLVLPGDSSFLLPFSDVLDLLILLLMFIAIMKD
jgi:hypothetical protein